MDQFPPAIPDWVSVALLGAWLTLGLAAYFYVARLVISRGGRVSAAEFGQPDFLLCIVFVVLFGQAATSGFGGPEKDVTQPEIIHGGILFLGIVALIGCFLFFRGINPWRQFGLARSNVAGCAAIAAGLLFCAFPLVTVAGRVTEIALNGRARPQNIVRYFMNASQDSDKGAIYLTMLLGAVIAPVAEETIFRGYIYGVLKRYVGGVAAAVIGAGLFAAMHMNLGSLPALFVLALCFTLAYEATGSLLVNIFMHAFFNLSMFLLLLWVSRQPPSP